MTRERFLEIIRFCFVGGVSFLMDYFLLYALTEWAGIYYLYSSAISFSVTVIFNYWPSSGNFFHDGRGRLGFESILHVAIRCGRRLALHDC